jgi:hypothetical protein
VIPIVYAALSGLLSGAGLATALHYLAGHHAEVLAVLGLAYVWARSLRGGRHARLIAVPHPTHLRHGRHARRGPGTRTAPHKAKTRRTGVPA